MRRVQTHSARVALAAGAALLLAAVPAVRAGGLSSLRSTSHSGERYITLKDLASFYGFSTRSSGKKICLQSKWSSLTFEVQSRSMQFNDMLLWLHMPLAKVRGRWAVAEVDVYKSIDPLLRPDAYLPPRGRRVVVLDPGHGGQDRGARGNRAVEEKRVVLDVAKRARVHLANAGLKVYLTRETDRYLKLEDRCNKAARWGADVFVSIHLNSARSSSPKGIETYVLASAGYPVTADTGGKTSRVAYPGNQFDTANVVLGACLQKGLLAKVGGQDRGLRRARFVVLKNAPCPAGLVECGFLSNAYEEALMISPEHREKIALAIAKGIIDYVNAVKRAQVAAP